MKISTRTRYALRALIYIGLESEKEGNFVRIKDIAEHETLSVQYLEQILFKLKKKGFIIGRRGPKGGYELGMPAEEITTYEIFLTLEEENQIVLCDVVDKHCEANCPTRYLWNKIEKSISKIMKDTTLKEMIDAQKDKQ